MTMVAGNPKPFWSGWTKWVGLMIAGGITGALAGHFGMGAVEDSGLLDTLEGSELAIGTALLYLLMGIIVGLGSLAPRVGAAFLNVEDADEIREEKASLLSSALGCIIMAAILIVVALGNPEVGFVAPGVAASVALALFGIATAASWRSWKSADELMRAIMRDAGAASYYILFAVLGVWTAAAHLGFGSGPRPLDIFALLFAAPLAATFWVVGRRGMMLPRDLE